MSKGKDIDLVTGKMWSSSEGIHWLAISTKPFGAADIVLVSKDKETWIQHDAKKIMEDIENEIPIKVA